MEMGRDVQGGISEVNEMVWTDGGSEVISKHGLGVWRSLDGLKAVKLSCEVAGSRGKRRKRS